MFVESPIVRIAAFKVDYEVKCSSLNSNSSKSVVSTVLSHRRKELQKICGEGKDSTDAFVCLLS